MVVRQAPSQEQRQAAFFNSTAVHASFGDIELAQITLRGAVRLCPDSVYAPKRHYTLLTIPSLRRTDGIGAGLDFDAALKDPAMVKFQGSPQVQKLFSRLCALTAALRSRLLQTCTALLIYTAICARARLSGAYIANI